MSKDTEPFLDQALATIAGLDTAASTLGGALRRTDATDLADAKADALRLHREKMDLFEENFRLRSALIHVRGIIKDGAMTGFNCQEGDWADRLFASQAMTHDALATNSAAPSDA